MAATPPEHRPKPPIADFEAGARGFGNGGLLAALDLVLSSSKDGSFVASPGGGDARLVAHDEP